MGQSAAQAVQPASAVAQPGLVNKDKSAKKDVGDTPATATSSSGGADALPTPVLPVADSKRERKDKKDKNDKKDKKDKKESKVAQPAGEIPTGDQAGKDDKRDKKDKKDE